LNFENDISPSGENANPLWEWVSPVGEGVNFLCLNPDAPDKRIFPIADIFANPVNP
jgi:hypothetical protein